MSDRNGRTNSERFPHIKGFCRVCGKPLGGKRRTFCDQRCLRDFFMKTDWRRVRAVIYERDGGICMKCGRKVRRKEFHVDHIVPISRGGSEWDLANLELSCPECNLKKGVKLNEPEMFSARNATNGRPTCSECGKPLSDTEIMPNSRGIICCSNCYGEWMEDWDDAAVE